MNKIYTPEKKLFGILNQFNFVPFGITALKTIRQSSCSELGYFPHALAIKQCHSHLLTSFAPEQTRPTELYEKVALMIQTNKNIILLVGGGVRKW